MYLWKEGYLMKVRVALALAMLLSLLMAMAIPSYAGKGGNGKGKDTPAGGQHKPKRVIRHHLGRPGPR